MQRRTFVAASLATALPMPLPLFGAEPAPKPKMMKTLMAKRGKPLYQDAFIEDDLKKNWKHIFGFWTIADRQLKAVEDPSKNHHGEVWATTDMKDVVIQLSFRFDGGTMLGLGLEHTDEKGNDHLFRSTVHPDRFYMMQGSGWSGTTKLDRVAEKKIEFVKDRWYTMVVEIVGNAMLAHIDNQHVIYAEADGIDTAKNQLSLQIRGDAGYYANVGIWEAIPDKAWAGRKAAVLKEAAKN